MIREVAGSWVVIPLGASVVEFNGILALSESGAFLWKTLEDGAGLEELIQMIKQRYDVDIQTATTDVNEFMESIKEKRLLE